MTLPELLDERRSSSASAAAASARRRPRPPLAVAAARRGRRTAVLTVDPAQRLKDALGLGEHDGKPHRRARLAARARLDAMLLDVKRTFDELVIGLASSPAQAQRILDNRLYQNLSGTLAGSAEYMAVESVLRLAETGDYDLLVVDTPPARHAVDFLDAPRRLLALLDSRAFSILKDPSSILPAAGSRLASMVLERGPARARALHRHRARARGRRLRPRDRGSDRGVAGPRRDRWTPSSRATRRRSCSSRRRNRTSSGRPVSWRRRSPPCSSACTAWW